MPDHLQDHPNPYQQAACALPGCSLPLHIVWTSDRAIYLADTAEDLRNPASAHTTTWHVTCEAGHIVLVPIDSGEDIYDFGACCCDPDEPADAAQFCGHSDLDRLRAVTVNEAAPND